MIWVRMICRAYARGERGLLRFGPGRGANPVRCALPEQERRSRHDRPEGMQCFCVVLCCAVRHGVTRGGLQRQSRVCVCICVCLVWYSLNFLSRIVVPVRTSSAAPTQPIDRQKQRASHSSRHLETLIGTPRPAPLPSQS